MVHPGTNPAGRSITDAVGAMGETSSVRHSDLRERLIHHLGDGFAQAWARDQVLAGLEFRTVEKALDDGEPVLRVWRAVWRELELPESER